MELSTNELVNIQGGAIKYAGYVVIGGLIAFIVGVVDGYLRPLKCNR